MLSMPQTGGNQWNGMQQSSMPVIQSVSSLAGTGELPARPDRLPTEPVPPAQIQQQVQIQTQTITQTVKVSISLPTFNDIVPKKLNYFVADNTHQIFKIVWLLGTLAIKFV